MGGTVFEVLPAWKRCFYSTFPLQGLAGSQKSFFLKIRKSFLVCWCPLLLLRSLMLLCLLFFPIWVVCLDTGLVLFGPFQLVDSFPSVFSFSVLFVLSGIPIIWNLGFLYRSSNFFFFSSTFCSLFQENSSVLFPFTDFYISSYVFKNSCSFSATFLRLIF